MESKKKAGVAILISDKIDFKATKIKRDKEGHYIMVKRNFFFFTTRRANDTTRRANDPKHIWTQYRSTQIHKANS